MTDERWNPKTALRRAVPFFHALPHLSAASLTTCGGLTLHIEFNPDTCELVAYDDADSEIARVPFEMTP
ncbi:hypothetical protein [Acidithiobacillus sulfurivorans]|uniref:Uncharacterized protein n=1 Tax=Acidithiobacillus sulfurivorans TaxID=1958756 RepID=A0ABS6A0Z0_9PROT|nr:hypothetical protein [Acidithiobacillus sulfurivorans]MBU2760579.1 hypothetical protein [Acidithiobacillus sulfurivorans]